MSEEKGFIKDPCGDNVKVSIDATITTGEWVDHFPKQSPFKDSGSDSSVSAR